MERLRTILDLLAQMAKDGQHSSSWTLSGPVETKEIVHFFRTGEKPRDCLEKPLTKSNLSTPDSLC